MRALGKHANDEMMQPTECVGLELDFYLPCTAFHWEHLPEFLECFQDKLSSETLFQGLNQLRRKKGLARRVQPTLEDDDEDADCILQRLMQGLRLPKPYPAWWSSVLCKGMWLGITDLLRTEQIDQVL